MGAVPTNRPRKIRATSGTPMRLVSLTGGHSCVTCSGMGTTEQTVCRVLFFPLCRRHLLRPSDAAVSMDSGRCQAAARGNGTCTPTPSYVHTTCGMCAATVSLPGTRVFARIQTITASEPVLRRTAVARLRGTTSVTQQQRPQAPVASTRGEHHPAPSLTPAYCWQACRFMLPTLPPLKMRAARKSFDFFHLFWQKKKKNRSWRND